MYIYIYLYLYIYIYVFIYIFYIYTYIYIYMYISIYLHIYIYIYICSVEICYKLFKYLHAITLYVLMICAYKHLYYISYDVIKCCIALLQNH